MLGPLQACTRADETAPQAAAMDAWVVEWRRALADTTLTWGAAMAVVERCPLLPNAEACVPTRLLRREPDDAPLDVVHGAPWLVAGRHQRCDLRLGPGGGVRVQCLLWTTEDAQHVSTV